MALDWIAVELACALLLIDSLIDGHTTCSLRCRTVHLDLAGNQSQGVPYCIVLYCTVHNHT
jgi:hypothetical protein